MKDVLTIENLSIQFQTQDGVIQATDLVSFSLGEGEILGIVGESGSGKTVTAHAVLGLIDTPPGIVRSGKINYRGTDLLQCDRKYLHSVRGKHISIIFQELLSSLNPVFTVGEQLSDVIRTHCDSGNNSVHEQCCSLLKSVGIPDPERRLKQYPHQLSGGLRQRFIIAMAIAAGPEIIIADEPTTALDVTLQAQILQLLKDLSRQTGAATMLITHDIASVIKVCDRVVVMFNGQVLEQLPVSDLFNLPLHPYTDGLLKSIKGISKRSDACKANPEDSGFRADAGRERCSYLSRCTCAMERCSRETPSLINTGNGHVVRCFLYQKVPS